LVICSSVVISATAGSFVRPAIARPPVAVLAGDDSDHRAGRNGAKCDPTDNCEQSQADTAIDSATKDESGDAGDRQSGERLLPDVLGYIPVARRALSWVIHGKLSDQATRLTICAAT